MNIEVKSTHDAQDDPRNDDILIWVNGELVRKDDAKVSVYDSGFMLGDGMWEGMRLYNGVWIPDNYSHVLARTLPVKVPYPIGWDEGYHSTVD